MNLKAPLPAEIPESELDESACYPEVLPFLNGLSAAAGKAKFSECPMTYFFNFVSRTRPTGCALLVTFNSAVHEAVADHFAVSGLRTALQAGNSTSFKAMLDQMAESGDTAFTVRCPNPVSGQFMFSHFLIRTQPAIANLKSAMSWARFVALKPEKGLDALTN